MIALTGTTRAYEFEPFGVAVGAAVVCGILSTFTPWLIAPTASLSALALAGWVSLARRRGTLSWRHLRGATAATLTVLGGAAVGFLDSPAPLAPLRGLFLAGGLVPFFVIDRLRSGPRRPSFSEV
ncbi:MAG TPA: hypothetical protein VEG66_07880 [Thermoplasmata archaeon]|jgi:hypothetical protein|nr:hypothetical protein [Thermoplasmata archaeon]